MGELGTLVFVLVTGVIALYCLDFGVSAEKASRRWAGLALCFGFGTWCFSAATASLVRLDPVADAGVAKIVIALRVFFGFVGLVLALAALGRRGRDQGAGVAGPAFAVLLAVLHIGAGVQNFREIQRLAEVFALEESGPEAWVYRSREHDFQLRLPSSRWVERSPTDSWVTFGHVLHPMQLFIVSAEQGFAADFEAAAQKVTSNMDRNAKTAAAQHERGTNAKGCRYLYSTKTERGESGPVFVAHSVSWCPNQAVTVGAPLGEIVELIFEAKLGAPTPADQVSRIAAVIAKSVESRPR